MTQDQLVGEIVRFIAKGKGSLTHLSGTIAAITYATRALSSQKLLPSRAPSPSTPRPLVEM